MKYLTLMMMCLLVIAGWRIAAPSLAEAQLINDARSDITARTHAQSSVRFRKLNAWRDMVCGEINAAYERSGEAGFTRFFWTRDAGVRYSPGKAAQRPAADLLQTHIEARWREDYDRCQTL